MDYLRTPLLFFVSLIIFCFILAGCPQPNSGMQGKGAETGSISGTARFTSGTNHAGITVTLEETDGLRSLSAVSAARNVASGADPARSLALDRSVQAQTNGSGKYSFSNVAPGFYTVYASSLSSRERAVAANVQVTAGMLNVTAPDLNLTPVGSISGRIRLDGNNTGNFGFLVSIAGTSYMAITDAAGNFTVSDIPAGGGYYIVMRHII